MDKLIAQLKFPNGSSAQIPNQIPANLQGDFATSGTALIQLVINSFFLLIVTTSLIFIIISGIRLITSRGNVSAISSARKQLIYSIIGLVVGVMAFFLVKTVITVLGGTPTFWKLP